LAALKVLAFLSALSNPAAIDLLVLPPTICQASPKNHSTVSVFTLALQYTVHLNFRDECQQQQLDTEPSFIGKKMYSVEQFILARLLFNFLY
jgi:hypothetical protein